ncbi:WYL domain-containing protein [Enterococcus sp. LJL51]|uniref:WYL domain-containing protein n=1 Tax=Enterococcus sp. LJL51 TaxID=3416656 RepID=UPI003CF9CD5E
MNQLFHEVYGRYFQIVSKVLAKKERSEEEIRQLAEAYGYGETAFSLLPYLLSEEDNWHLLKKKENNFQRITANDSFQPTTKLEKRWLKTILQDPKIHLFLTTEQLAELNQILKEEECLFSLTDIDYFDQFQSGDPFENEDYQQNARTLLKAITSDGLTTVKYQTLGREESICHTIKPEKLEYSQKNDKFRLKGQRLTKNGSWEGIIFNLSEIRQVEMLENHDLTTPLSESFSAREAEKQIVCLLRDDRDTLERAMFHFSNYRKVTQKTENEKEYSLTIYYPAHYETELVINILSFGPFLKVIEPESFIHQIRYRLKKQKELLFPNGIID